MALYPSGKYPNEHIDFHKELWEQFQRALDLLKRTQEPAFDNKIDSDIQSCLWDNAPRTTFYLNRQMLGTHYAFIEDANNLLFRNEDDLLASWLFEYYQQREGFIRFGVDESHHTVYAEYADGTTWRVGQSDKPLDFPEIELMVNS